ncbi:MAG TPA: L-histidine N(alpha)-methyltransferase [Candidatus Saccharimonadales bacterium]|nr:L-histidine N(alpha)-methyltransferase [Candidatus Saccharimonadales bacterium]
MLYFKHTELSEKFKVSISTVHNWIALTKEGKLDLQLHEEGKVIRIANTPANLLKIEELVEQNKKFRNVRYHKVAEPTKEFYELYTRKQILDIITNLDTHREIPRQYNYFDEGAVNWDQYSQNRWTEEAPNLLKSTVELMGSNMAALDKLLQGHSQVNVIDIGPGNALPVKELLEHLVESGTLHRYIAIDISEEMLHIAKRNIKEWFGEKVKFEGYVRDITYERFDDIIVDDMLDKCADQTINLALLLGATPMNFRAPKDILKSICGSLGKNDLLVYTDKPDSEAERRSFNFNQPATASLSPNHRFIFDLLNIDDSLYDVEMGFNDQKKVRYIQVRLKVNLTIRFSFNGSERNVNLKKGDAILLWRVWHMSALEIISCFEEAGFGLLQSSLTKDREYILTISGVDTNSDIGV